MTATGLSDSLRRRGQCVMLVGTKGLTYALTRVLDRCPGIAGHGGDRFLHAFVLPHGDRHVSATELRGPVSMAAMIGCCQVSTVVARV